MTINPVLMTIRTKKLGLLMRDARQALNKSVEECAKAIGVSPAVLESYEIGERSPSLPEIEMLAYYLEIPLEHFWGNERLKHESRLDAYDPEKIKALRQRMIGAMLKKVRLERGKELNEVAEAANVPAERLQAYETGAQAVPLPELEVLLQVLSASVRDFQDQRGPVGGWFAQQKALQDFMNLEPEMQGFVSKPVNRPYLELAVRLSEMSVDRLRGVAEGLLEITL